MSVVWKMSAAWASKPFDCTLNGIVNRCEGGCCYKLHNLWPHRAFENKECAFFVKGHGCSLTVDERPIDCLLYPMMFNEKGNIVLHQRTCFAHSVCKGNYGKGSPLIVNLRECLTSIFGKEQYELALRMVMSGQDATFHPSDEVVMQRDFEVLATQLNLKPIKRPEITQQIVKEAKEMVPEGSIGKWWEKRIESQHNHQEHLSEQKPQIQNPEGIGGTKETM